MEDGKGAQQCKHRWEPKGVGVELIAQASIELRNGISDVDRKTIMKLLPRVQRQLVERRKSDSRFNLEREVGGKKASLELSGRTHVPVQDLIRRMEAYAPATSTTAA